MIETYVYPVRCKIHMHMYVLLVLLDPVLALDQFKGGLVWTRTRTRTRTIEDQSGPVLSGPALVLGFSKDFRTSPVLVLSKIDFRTRPDWTLKHYPFGNAVDGLGRPGMGSGLIRDCLGGVWIASRHE